MATLLRTSAARAFLHPFHYQHSFPVAARSLSTSQVTCSPSKKADLPKASTAKAAANNAAKGSPKKPKAKDAGDAKSTKKDTKETKLYSEPPKRAISVYPLFFAENMKQFQGSISEKMKAASAQWNALSAEEKQVWDTRAKEINAQRQVELEAWEAQLSPEALLQYKKDRRDRFRLRATKRAENLGITGIKTRGATAFMLFTQAYRRNPAQFDLPVVDTVSKNPTVTTAKALGQLWRSMTLGEKAPYIAQAEEESKKVKQELANRMAEKLQHSKTV